MDHPPKKKKITEAKSKRKNETEIGTERVSQITSVPLSLLPSQPPTLGDVAKTCVCLHDVIDYRAGGSKGGGVAADVREERSCNSQCGVRGGGRSRV